MACSRSAGRAGWPGGRDAKSVIASTACWSRPADWDSVGVGPASMAFLSNAELLDPAHFLTVEQTIAEGPIAANPIGRRRCAGSADTPTPSAATHGLMVRMLRRPE